MTLQDGRLYGAFTKEGGLHIDAPRCADAFIGRWSLFVDGFIATFFVLDYTTKITCSRDSGTTCTAFPLTSFSCKDLAVRPPNPEIHSGMGL